MIKEYVSYYMTQVPCTAHGYIRWTVAAAASWLAGNPQLGSTAV